VVHKINKSWRDILLFSVFFQLLYIDSFLPLFQLLQSERLSLFSASIRVCFLVFESIRSHLKFQLEVNILFLKHCMNVKLSNTSNMYMIHFKMYRRFSAKRIIFYFSHGHQRLDVSWLYCRPHSLR
jgi:hypothetical protein